MILLNNEPIARRSTATPEMPFQIGEVFFVKYMAGPTVVTIQARTDSEVKVWFATLSPEEFNERVLFKLGKRARFLGFWLPFVKCAPQVELSFGMPDALGSDFAFWTHRRKLPA